MRRGVKPDEMSLRSFVWSGGSRLIISSDEPLASTSSPSPGRNGFGALWKPFQSRDTRWTSA